MANPPPTLQAQDERSPDAGAHGQGRARRSGGRTWPMLATGLAGLVLTGLLCAAVRDIETARAEAAFAQRNAVRVAAVIRAFAEAENAARAIPLLFQSSRTVGVAEFTTFVTPIMRRHEYIDAIYFQRIVPDARRAAYERARRSTRPGFAITERRAGELVPAARRDSYLVNEFVAPHEGNESAYGFDVWSLPQRRQYTERAIDGGAAAASPMVMGQRRNDGRERILLVMPVYRHEAVLDGVASRRAAAIGMAQVVLDVDRLLSETLFAERTRRDAGFLLSLRAPDMRGRVVTAYHYGDLAMPRTWWEALLGDLSLRHAENVSVAGQEWQVVIEERHAGANVTLAELVSLALGLLATLAAAALVQQRAARRRRIEAVVEERTADLERATNALRLYHRAMEASSNPILLVDALREDHPIQYANPASTHVYGYAPSELVGQPIRVLAGRDLDLPSVLELLRALDNGQAAHEIVPQHTRDGAELVVDVHIAPVLRADGVTEHFVVTAYDVTTAKRYEAELEHRAHHDTLTGLANRALLGDRIERAITNAGNQPIWTVSLDIDQFKLINDTLGRRTGDEVLRRLAQRIASALPAVDTAARIGGDDFVLVLVGCSDERQASIRIAQVRAAIAAPLEIDGQRLQLSATAGVSAYPADGRDADTLIKHAEIAMYRAKSRGRGAVQYYAPHMNALAFERLSLEGALRQALADGQFELYYQPQVELASGRVVGTEALIRWHHPELGLVSPDRFIGLAEETGLIVPIGAWVLETACRQNRAWELAGYGPLRVGVNLSARQFAETDLADTVERVLRETGLQPGLLEIELTESMMMADADSAIQTMRMLKGMGLKLTIDDFGTGYSSLSYLRRLPVDVLKIDRSFVLDVATSSNGAALVEAIVSLAHGLGMRVIAEGADHPAQLERLRAFGCDEVQGNIFSAARAAIDLEPLLSGGAIDPVHQE